MTNTITHSPIKPEGVIMKSWEQYKISMNVQERKENIQTAIVACTLFAIGLCLYITW